MANELRDSVQASVNDAKARKLELEKIIADGEALLIEFPAEVIPVIGSFTATPSNSPPSMPVALAWSVTGAETVAIDQGVGEVELTGTRQVTPAVTTAYKLTATNGAGSVDETETVTIAAIPPAPPPPPPVGLKPGDVIAQEHEFFTLPAPSRIRYGAQDGWAEKDVAANTSTQCNNATFGDPMLGVVKQCIYVGPALGSPPAPPPPSPPAPPPVPAPDGIVANGKIDPVKYRAMAANFWNAIDYRFGPPAPKTIAGTKYYERPYRPFPHNSNTQGGRGGVSPELNGSYHVGIGSGWTVDAGDFSSNISHIAYVADDAEARIGAAGIMTLGVSNHTFGYVPELHWVRGGEGVDGFEIAHPWRDQGHPTRKVLCAARGVRPGWSVQTLFWFAPDASGRSFMASLGANTQSNRVGMYMPAGLTPTAAAVSNSNEFAFVTCWDTARVRGVLVVIALTSLGDGGTRANPDPYSWTREESNWGAQRIEMPGIANLGNWMAAKVIGQIDLPANMVAPTDISCTTMVNRHGYMAADASGWPEVTWGGFKTVDRVKFQDGGQYGGSTASEGMAVIVSRTEKTVCFVDLKPLFQYYRSMYFTADQAVYNQTLNLGDAPNQWPYTFAQAPQQRPTVRTTINLTQVPVCVHAVPWGDPDVFIGTESGNLLKYAHDGSLRATYTTGANITCIHQLKEKASNVQWDYTKTMVVVCRGERAIKFIDQPTGAILKTIVPSVDQCEDPIAVQDSDNHGDTSEIIDVADYSGRKVVAYSYGPTIIRGTAGSFGPGPNGGEVAEFGGAFLLPGKPWFVDGANIS